MVCKCGYQNNPDAGYCAQCGRKLKKKKGGFKWWLAVILILLGIGIGVGAAVMFLGEEETGLKDSIAAQEPQKEDPSEEPEDTTAAQPQTEESTEPPRADGWYEEEGGIRCYLGGKPALGIQDCPAGSTESREFAAGCYYFNAQGLMQTGWQEIDGQTHYFTPEGPAAAQGWYEDSKGWYCLAEQGRLIRSETLQVGADTYVVGQDGYLDQVTYSKIACTDKPGYINNTDILYMAPDRELKKCTGFSVSLAKGGDNLSSPQVGSSWIVYIYTGLDWKKLDGSMISAGVDGSVQIKLDTPMTVRGVYMTPNVQTGQKITLDKALYNVTVEY